MLLQVQVLPVSVLLVQVQLVFVAGAGAGASARVGAAPRKPKPAAEKTVKNNDANSEPCAIFYTELGGGLSLVEGFQKLMGAAQEVFGPPSAMSVPNATNETNVLALAIMGEHVTPERCKAELDLIAELDRTIERSLDRFDENETCQRELPEFKTHQSSDP